MYNLIDENVFEGKDGIAYVYVIPQINLMYSNAQQTEDTIAEIIKKVKMPGEIKILPTVINKKRVSAKYEDIKKRNQIDDYLIEPRERFVEETIATVSKRERYDYNLYLAFEERVSSNKGIFKFSTESKLNAKQMDLSKKLNDVIFSEIKKVNTGVKKVDATEMTRVINYLEFNTEKRVDCAVINENTEHIVIEFENENGELEKVFSKNAQAVKFPLSAIDFIFMSNILKQNFAIDISTKFDIDINNAKLERKMFHAKNNIKKDQKKYKRDNGRMLQEYKEAITIAEEGVKNFQGVKTALIHFQMQFRIRARDENMLQSRFEHLKKIIKESEIDIISSLGKQYNLHKNFQFLNTTTDEYTQKVDSEYFKKLKLQMGNNIGLDNWGDSVIKFYQYPSQRPVFIDEFAPLREGSNVKATSSVVAYTGVTGCGKSQMANSNMLSNILMKNTKQLMIDPKGDRKGFANKIPYGEKFVNEIDLSDSTRYAGALDPFIGQNDISKLELSVANNIKFFLGLEEELELYDNRIIKSSLDSYLKSSEFKTFTGFLNHIADTSPKGKEIAERILSYSSMKYASLYFADEKTEEIINYTKHLNIILIDEINMSDIGSIEGKLTSKALIDIELLAKRFMRETPGNFEIHLEEYEYYTEITGTSIGKELSKLVRSFGGVLNIYAQNPSSIESGVFNMLSSIFVGNLTSDEELEFICKKYKLNKSDFMFLLTTVDEDDVVDDDKYIFLYVDVNNRKAQIRMEILPMFKEAFNTKLKREESTT